MQNALKTFLRKQALEKNRLVSVWRRFGGITLEDWTEYLKRHGGFQSFGENNAINPGAHFSTSYLISIGNNVRIAGGFFSAHDGSVNMLNRAYDATLDGIGAIKIGNDVFIGFGAIVLPNVTIGNKVIVGAGAVVSRDIEDNSVVVGSPARKVCTLDDYFARVSKRNETYPWRDLLLQRQRENYDEIEAKMRPVRIDHYFGAGR